MIQDTLSKVVYTADGLQRQWDVPFQFNDSADLHIYLTDDGVRIEEVFQNFEFNKEGNYFIYPTEESGLAPLEAGKQILILRETPNTQEEDSSEIYFKSKDIERGLDKLTMQVQELARDSYRAVKVSHFDTISPEDFTETLFETGAQTEAAAAAAAASASNASLSEQNAASSKLSAEQASASATASAELAQSAANNSLQYAERAESAAAGSAASAVSSAESASLAQDLLNQVGESVYSKPEIDAKVSGLQAEIDLVESYIPLGTNDTNTLVNKQQLLDEEMDIREDLNEGLSDLQTQITAQASAIANKQDKLVAGSNITIVGNVISSTGGGDGSGVEVEPATEEQAGIISISTSEEAREGLDDTTAMTPLKTAQVIYDNVGRAIQLGFDGTLSGNVLTFEPDTDTAYELKTGYNYTIDLLFPAVVTDGTLDENISMVINNNGESIKIVNALNDDVDTDITVGNMKQIMKYTTDIGFRWIFNASLANTADGRKVFVMPSTVVNVPSGDSVPDNVYTQENLLGGNNIEIVPEPVEGGIDEDTLACWHFDNGNTTDEINGIDAQPNGATAAISKFGDGSGNGEWGITELPFAISSNGDFSFDYWLYRPYDSWYSMVGFIEPSYYNAIMSVYCFAGGGQIGVGVMTNPAQAINTSAVVAAGTWAHIYCHYKKETRTFACAVNGKFVFSEVNESDFMGITENTVKWSVVGACYVDELRISKCVRWEEDFEPPTQPYRLAVPTGNYVVNFTGEEGQSGKNIGEVYYSQSSLASDNAGALPLFTGETIASANTIYPDFYVWVESHTELQATAEEYESALSTYGECPKYVVSNGSLRLPKLANYIKMANTTEGITQSEAGLPNIEGSFKAGVYADATGAFTVTQNQGGNGGYEEWNQASVYDFDASKSNPVYGNSDTVTPAHTTLYPWVFAYNASVPASTAQAAEFQEGLSGKVDLVAGVTNDKVDYVVDSYSDEEGNWYRIYKSGWIEQGGHQSTVVGEQFAEQTVMLLKPMKNTTYHKNLIASFSAKGDHTIVVRLEELTLYTDRIIVRKHWLSENGSFYWEVKGQGA